MKVFFRVMVCVLIFSPHLLTIAQDYSTLDPTTTVPDQSEEKTSTDDPATPVSGEPEESTSTESAKCVHLTPPNANSTAPNKTFVNITWDVTQADPNCVPNYLDVSCEATKEDNPQGDGWLIPNGSGAGSFENGSSTISVIVKDLSEFTKYTCNGILLTTDDQTIMSDQIEFTTEPDVATAPRNLTVTTTRPVIIDIKWEKPAKNPGIFVSYHIHTVSHGPNYSLPDSCEDYTLDIWNDTTEEKFSFTHLRTSYNYEISVFLENSAGNGSDASISETTATAASKEPRNVSIGEPELNEGANVVTRNISWKMPCESNGPIDQFEVYLEGIYMLDNEIIDRRSVLVDVSDTEDYSKQIDLSPASFYTIGVRANGGNMKGEFHNETFVTEDNLPGVPRTKDIIDKGSTFFVVSWDEPERRAGYITNYIVVISGEPLYDRDMDRCPFEKQFTETFSGESRTYNFTEGLPYFEYNISISAVTSKGDGEPSVIVVETESFEPDKPDNLSFSLTDDRTGLISWRTPCNINGPIEGFSITINGTYSDDNSIHDAVQPETLPFEEGTFIYNHSVELMEAFIYDAYVRVVLDDGTMGEVDVTSNTTPDGYPGVPIIKPATNVADSSFTLEWDPPSKKNGRINNYTIIIASLRPLYETQCPINNYTSTHTEDGSMTAFRFTEGDPYYNYSVTITASTSRGFGNASEEFFVITNQSIPESVQAIYYSITSATKEDYNANVSIHFKEPCRLNGVLKDYELEFNGSRPNYNDHTGPISQKDTSPFIFDLKPEFHYIFSIKTINEYATKTSDFYSFQAPAGVPKFSSTIDLNIRKDSSSAQVTLWREHFNEENGEIRYMALIISENNVTGEEYKSWDGEHWPNITRNDDVVYYQLSKDWWDPFEDASNVTITIGNETDCNESQNYCNKPLEKDKDYYLIIRIFTTNFYRNSPTIYFRTDDVSKLGMILGIIFGLLAFALLGTAGFFVWKRNIMQLPPLFAPRKSSARTSTTPNTSIPVHKFMQYCKNLENNPEKITEQYALLAEKTKEAVRLKTTVFAELTENRRKNRYTNILPYDDTRVKIQIDEDDEIASDYINASYIKGYSGNTEYIATQGPLPTTCRDFWKMVIQENVSIIVMVTQFVEQNKEKCYKYFPNNHENMMIGEDMEVKCTMELHFGTYCVRTLQVKKDTTQATVTHMQYLDWPDFNVPNGTESMLQFCYQLRERLKIEGGYVIIHCSAGVGRTGTLIATDILLQNVIAGKNIDVFNTVLELRKQRTHMVQTQKQYAYIHNLIKDNFDQSHTSGLHENSEPLYENLSAVKMKADDDNLIAKDEETESQF